MWVSSTYRDRRWVLAWNDRCIFHRFLYVYEGTSVMVLCCPAQSRSTVARWTDGARHMPLVASPPTVRIQDPRRLHSDNTAGDAHVRRPTARNRLCSSCNLAFSLIIESLGMRLLLRSSAGTISFNGRFTGFPFSGRFALWSRDCHSWRFALRLASRVVL